MYYRIFDKETGDPLYSGYNSRSLQEVTDAFVGYKESDFMNEDDYNEVLSMSKYERISYIESCGFIIQRSKRKFKELN